MKNKNSYAFIFKVLALTVIYLVIAVSHIFYLSNSTTTKTTHSVSLFKRKIESMPGSNAIQRTDKAIIKETVSATVAKAPVLKLFIPSTNGYVLNNVKQVIPLGALAYGSNRHVHIQLCTFRI